MAAWDFFGGVVQLALRSFFVNLKDIQPDGILAGRAFSGALFVTGSLYLIAALHPTRYRFILWLAVGEQLIAICTGVFHGARNDVAWGGLVLPIAVAIALMILVLLNFPRGISEELAASEAGEEAEATSADEGPPGKE
jgi:hypothetical protein